MRTRLFLLVMLCYLLCGLTLAEAPPLVSFQGKLTDPSGVPVARYNQMLCLSC